MVVAVRLGLCFAVACGLWPSWVLADKAAMPVSHAPSNAAVRTRDAGSTMMGVAGAQPGFDATSVSLHLKITREIEASLNATASKSTVLAGSTQLVGVSIPLARDAGSAIATINEKDAASALKPSNLSAMQVRQDMVFNCMQTYFDRELARMRVRVAESALERAREIARINVLLEQAGKISRMMLLQSDLAVTQAQVTLAQSEEDAKVAERTLLKSIGMPQASTSSLQIELKDCRMAA